MAAHVTLFTIGHSSHTLEAFVGLLRRHAISAVADVRSAPYSRYCPHFNKDALARSLRESGIGYVFLGRKLGGRSDDPSCYRNGRADYAQLARQGAFREGIERLRNGAADHRIAIMCAEREPLECHRALLVSPALDKEGTAVGHIHADGSLESHREAMDRLIDIAGMTRGDLFRYGEQIVSEALDWQAERIAHRQASHDAGDAGERR